MSYIVKNVKTFRGMDGEGYNATLYRDGVKVAFVMNEGSGGDSHIQWYDTTAPRVDVPWVNHDGQLWTIRATPEEAKLYEHIRGKTWSFDGKDQGQIDQDIFIGQLIDDFENDKRFRRLCKKETIFRVRGDPDNEYRTIKAPFSLKVKQFIVNKYGDTVEVIMNERFGQAI